MTLFSERNKHSKPKIIGPEEMTDELRNRLWNALDSFIDNNQHSQREALIERTWDRFYKQDISELNGWTSYK